MELVYLNYKVPLKPVEEGVGYLGTLAQTADRELVQCHICGELCANLGSHVFGKHGMKAADYRVKFQLGRRTPLCSDRFSEVVKERQLAAWAALSETEREARRDLMRKAQEGTTRVGNPRSLEALNKDGMCPDQLIDHIQKLATKLEKSPSQAEFLKEYAGKYIGAIRRTFGSWAGAKRIAGLERCKTGSLVPHNRAPYTDEELLEYLRSAYKEKGQMPTHSDWVKGFLPSYYLYKHRFGGIRKARELAGITQNTPH